MPNKTCRQCRKSFVITGDASSFYAKIDVPPPTLCPDCRYQRRLAFRNEMTLYMGKCARCGKEMLTRYNPRTNTNVYCISCWNSDGWEALEYGRPYDKTRSFFKQFAELYQAVPKAAIVSRNSENCDYCNSIIESKNCYYAFSTRGENCLYGYRFADSVDCCEVLYSAKDQLCYEMVNTSECYSCSYLRNCKNCRDSELLSNCQSCRNCRLCTGLKNKAFCYRNEQYTEVEYQKIIIRESLFSWKTVQKSLLSLNALDRQAIHLYLHGSHNESSTGDYLENCKSCINCYDVEAGEHCINATDVSQGIKDSQDVNNCSLGTELAYESIGGMCYDSKFTNAAIGSRQTEYSVDAFNLSECFGCVGLRKQEDCILNKKYSHADYLRLRKEIIETMRKQNEYGEFFPPAYSAFGYNESVAQVYFPLQKELALKQKWNWRDDMPGTYGKETVRAIPDKITDVPESITGEVLACECDECATHPDKVCGKNFRITSQELKFYRKQGIPLPHQCFDCRHRARVALRNPRHLWSRTCDKCGKDMQSTYAPNRPEKIYCEECYQKAIL